MLKLAIASGVFALTLAACQSTGTSVSTPRTALTPENEKAIIEIVARLVEGSSRTGTLTAWEFKSARISAPFNRSVLVGPDPFVSYCVELDHGFALAPNLGTVVDVFDKADGGYRAVANFTQSGLPPLDCAGKAVSLFPRLIELRQQRRANRPADKPPEQSVR
jgi:hypothetical protein